MTWRSVPVDLTIQHHYGAPRAAAVALCEIVASTALMIAMAVMVTSFRGAVDDWLDEILTGDFYVRSEPGWGGFDAAAHVRLAAVPGVKAMLFNRQIPIVLNSNEPSMALIARLVGKGDAALRLIGQEFIPPRGTVTVWL